jgi:NAD(P)-dependent dehydrogenase (short-subunit alcohol dehydrogenase family)
MARGCIIVTGASRGIGAAIAVDLARRGYDVAGLSRSGTTSAGVGYACDMTDEAEIARTIAKIAARGPIGGLVNNAGQYALHKSAEIKTADYEAMMRVNATSTLIAAREAHPHLKAAGGGLIVNLSSFFARLGVNQHLAYCASKAAIEAMTRCLAVEWARDNIRVLAVAPGYINTDFNVDFFASERGKQLLASRVPVRRVGEPDEVGRLVGSLFESEIGFLTGETIQIDGGQGINL